jgi:hypothetical protein
MEEISDEFRDAILGGGTSYMQECSCGRIHFCVYDVEPQAWWGHDNDDIEEKPRYYNELVKDSETKPDKVIMHVDGISYAEINGECIVIGCPCLKDVKIEKWIWSHRHIISTYLNSRVLVEIERAFNEVPITYVAGVDKLEQVISKIDKAIESFKKLTQNSTFHVKHI